jgi:hypothetical protein
VIITSTVDARELVGFCQRVLLIRLSHCFLWCIMHQTVWGVAVFCLAIKARGDSESEGLSRALLK